MNEFVGDEILRVLGDYLDKRVGFKQVIKGWPDYNQKLIYPCLALLIRGPLFRPFPVQELSRPKTNGTKADILYATGDYEFPVTLNIWAQTKAQRNDLYERLFMASATSSAEAISMAFSLPMPRYHGLPVSLHFEGFDLPDGPETALSGEWRLIIKMRAFCDAVVRKDNEPIITSIDLDAEVTEQPITEGSGD